RLLGQVLTSSHVNIHPPQPRSALFPYTTLFRSSTAVPATTPLTAASAATTSPAAKVTTASTPARPGTLSTAATATTTSTDRVRRSEEHTSELQSRVDVVCRLLLEKKKADNSECN